MLNGERLTGRLKLQLKAHAIQLEDGTDIKAQTSMVVIIIIIIIIIIILIIY
jgi:hypothetical protein